MPTAKIDKLDHGHFDRVPLPKTAARKVNPHLAYLEFLKEHGLLEMALRNELPPNIEQAAKICVIGALRDKYGKDAVPVVKNGEQVLISVSEDDKKTQDEEVNEFIKHYRFEKAFEPFIFKSMPVEILKGQKHVVKSGQFQNRVVLVKGFDTECFGCRWDENFGNVLCESYMFRMQSDNLPVRGLVYVVKLLEEKRDILLHESELGDHIQ